MASSGNGRCKAFASSQGAQPHVAFLVGRQDHRHRLRMDRLDDGVRRGREKAIDEVRSGDRLPIDSALIAVE